MKYLFFFLCFMINLMPAFGQNLSDDDVKMLEMGERISVQAGQPVVLLPKKNVKEEEFIPLDAAWQPEQSYVKIKTLTGDDLQVPDITHIPYFFTYIQVLPDTSVVVTEKFSLILAEQYKRPFIRSYLKNILDVRGNASLLDLEFLSVRYNGVSVLPIIKDENQTVSIDLFNKSILSSGLHSFEFSYLVKNALKKDGNISRLFLSILGNNIPFLIDNFQALVVYPENTKLHQAKAVFGVNNQVVQDAYSVYINELGNLFFKMNGIIPQHADVRLDILADAKGFSSTLFSEKISDDIYKNKWWIISLICIFVSFLYFKFTAIELKDRFLQSRYLTFFRKNLNYDLGVMSWILYRKIDSHLILAYLLQLSQKGALDIQIDKQSKIILKKSKTSSVKDKRILSLFFSFFSKQVKLKDIHLSVKKLKKFITRRFLCQKWFILRREILSGLLFVVLSMLALFYLQVDKDKIFISFILSLLAYFMLVIYFIYQVKLETEFKKLFKEYILLPKTPEKSKVIDVAVGELNLKTSGKLKVNGKEFPLSEFIELFDKQFDLRRK